MLLQCYCFFGNPNIFLLFFVNCHLLLTRSNLSLQSLLLELDISKGEILNILFFEIFICVDNADNLEH